MTEAQLLKKVGANIRAARLQRKIGYRNFAAMCNMDASNIRRLELGRVNSHITSIHKIASVLNVDVTEFFK